MVYCMPRGYADLPEDERFTTPSLLEHTNGSTFGDYYYESFIMKICSFANMNTTIYHTGNSQIPYTRTRALHFLLGIFPNERRTLSS